MQAIKSIVYGLGVNWRFRGDFEVFLEKVSKNAQSRQPQ